MTRRWQWLILIAVWLVLGVVGLAMGLKLGKRRALQSARPQPTAAAAQATLDPENLAATLAAQTVQALLTESAQKAPTATPLPPTDTPVPSATPTPIWFQSPTPSPTPTITPTPAPCHFAVLAGETIPDGTEMQPGQAFTKTWKLYNRGSCTWTTAYKVVFVQGERMSSPESVAIPLEVPPGTTVEVSISLVAPSEPGTYKAVYMLEDDEGQKFGLGPDGAEGPFWVEIVVVGPTDTPTPEATDTPTPGPSPTP